MPREATRSEAWDLVLRDAILAPALGLPDAAKLARVCRDSRAAVQAAWRERCLAVDADELERMYLTATRAGKTVPASMLLAAARERGLLLSSVVLGRVLVESAGAGNLEGVNALLAAGVEKRELLMWTTREESCLFAGAQNGHPEVVRALLAAAGAAGVLMELLMLNKDGVNCLFASAEYGHREVVMALLAAATTAGVLMKLLKMRCGQKWYTKNSGAGCLYISAKSGHLDVVEALLEAAGERQGELLKMARPRSCLSISAQHGHLGVLRALLKAADTAGVTHGLLMCRDDDGRSCLHSAAEKGHVRVLRALLEAADAAGVTHGLLMLRDGNGQSCLSLAVETNNAKLVPVLLEAAGERKLELLMISCNGDMGPLYMAAYRGLADTVKELLEAAAGDDPTYDGGREDHPFSAAPGAKKAVGFASEHAFGPGCIFDGLGLEGDIEEQEPSAKGGGNDRGNYWHHG